MDVFRLPGPTPKPDIKPELDVETIKPELVEDDPEAQQDDSDVEVKEEEDVKEEDVKEEEPEAIPVPPAEFRVLDYKFDADQLTRETQPKRPFTTKYPEFPSITRSPNAPHPLDKSSWFDPSLTLPPPEHLLTLDKGTSLFDANFSRVINRDQKLKSDIGRHSQFMIDKEARNICLAGWHSPPAPADGGPLYILCSPDWKVDINKMEDVRTSAATNAQSEGREVKPNEGSMSLFYGGGGHHTKSFRYRGDVKVYKTIKITPATFAQMGEEEKSQWIDFFRFENVVRRLRGELKVFKTPNDFFDYLSTPKSKGLWFNILQVTGYDDERINTWMENYWERKEREKEEKEATGAESDRRSRACHSVSAPATLAHMFSISAASDSSGAPTADVKIVKKEPKEMTSRKQSLRSAAPAPSDINKKPFLDVEEKKPKPPKRAKRS